MEPVLKNVARVGRVSSINPGDGTVRVVFEDRQDMVSYDLPVIVRQSLKNKDYFMPDVGEQVLCLFLPSGNAQGFILGAFYSDEDLPPVTDQGKRHVRFEDGTSIEYDRTTHTLSINAQGTINIKASGAITITGNIAINGNITLTGGDVTADGISLKTHVHGGVEPGGGTTGKPV